MERLNEFPIEEYKKLKIKNSSSDQHNNFIKLRLEKCQKVPAEYKGLKQHEIDHLMKDFSLLTSQMIFGHLNWIVLNNRWDVTSYLK